MFLEEKNALNNTGLEGNNQVRLFRYVDQYQRRPLTIIPQSSYHRATTHPIQRTTTTHHHYQTRVVFVNSHNMTRIIHSRIWSLTHHALSITSYKRRSSMYTLPTYLPTYLRTCTPAPYLPTYIHICTYIHNHDEYIQGSLEFDRCYRLSSTQAGLRYGVG